MTKAATPKDFPKHVALERTDEDRAALTDIQWHGYSAPAYKHLRSVDAIGVWNIGHPSANGGGEFEPVTISYSPPMEAGEDYKVLSEKMRSLEAEGLGAGDIEWNWTFSKMSPREIGYAHNQEAAKEFIELTRRQAPDQDPVQILIDGGFKLQHTIEARSMGLSATQVFYKEDDKRGHFTVFYSPEHMHVTHEKRGSHSWSNLLRFGTYNEQQDGFLMPHALSPEMASPMAAAVKMAVKLSNEWKPSPSVRRRKASP